MEKKFGVHLIHGHLQVGKGEVMFGKALNNPHVHGIWTRPTNIRELNLNDIHGHIFALNPSGQFMACESREGPPPPMNPNDDAFVAQFRAFLQDHSLSDLIGLQVLAGHGAKKMQEFDLSGSGPEGVVMLDAEDTEIDEVYRVTGWSAETAEPGGSELKGNDVHAALKNGNHKIFQDSKLMDENNLIDLLKRQGILN